MAFVIFERAGDSTGGCVHGGGERLWHAGQRAGITSVFCVIVNSFMSVLPIHETQKSQSGAGGPS